MLDKKITVGIIDDQWLIRTGLKAVLKHFHGIDVIMEAHDTLEFLDGYVNQIPDVLLIEVHTPIANTLLDLSKIKSRHPSTKVILMFREIETADISLAFEKDANACLGKSSDVSVIHEAICQVYKDEYYFNTLTSKALLQDLKINGNGNSPTIRSNEELNDKEKMILRLMAEEKTTKEIGKALNISHRTVEKIKDDLRGRIGVKTSNGLILYAAKNGLLQVE